MSGTIPWQTDSDLPTAIRELDIDAKKTALIVVDVQNYSAKNWTIAPNCVRLRDFFRERGLESPMVRTEVSQALPRHTLRGLHWQVGRSAGARVVQCLQGRMLEVVVDGERHILGKHDIGFIPAGLVHTAGSAGGHGPTKIIEIYAPAGYDFHEVESFENLVEIKQDTD